MNNLMQNALPHGVSSNSLGANQCIGGLPLHPLVGEEAAPFAVFLF